LIAVSCALAISVAFLLPIIGKAKKSKQAVLELFLHKKIERAIEDQLKLYRWFIYKYQARSMSESSSAGGGAIAIGGAGNQEGMMDQDGGGSAGGNMNTGISTSASE
jgi:hypothetical protein